MALTRAYSTLEIRSIDEEMRLIEGVASTPGIDRQGDIVEPSGAQYALPIPLLWQHDAKQPVGQVIGAQVSETGITIRAQIAKIADPGPLKDLVDLAWQAIKNKLVRGLSIGFLPIESANIEGSRWGQRFLKWEWLELSAVTIPANAEASIQTVKSCDVGGAAATGFVRPVRLVSVHTPGDSGSARASARPGSAMKKSYSQQIADLDVTLKAKSDRMDAMLEAVSEKGEAGFGVEQKNEYDELEGDVATLTEHRQRLVAAEARQKTLAAEVKAADVRTGAEARVPQIVRVSEPELPKGVAFARFVACKMSAYIEMHKGNFLSPIEIAKQRYPSHGALHAAFEKTAVAAGTTSASHAYDDLVPYQVLATDFIDYLRPATIIGKFGTNGIPALRSVPFNVRVGGFTAGTTGYWKGEGKPIPLSKATSENVTLTWATAAGLTVMTQELMRFSTPSAELALRNDLAAAVVARCDIDFVDPSKAAVSNTSPASITNAIVATAPSGTAAVNVRADLATMLALFAQNNLGRSNLVVIMSDTMAGNIQMMVNTLGNNEFPEMEGPNPRLRGLPVITSEHLTSVGSPSTQTIVLVKADEVYLADDGQVNVEASMEASLEMSDAPTQDGTAGTGASLVNLWQTGMIGIKAERVINWKLRRSTAVQYISPAAYAPPTS